MNYSSRRRWLRFHPARLLYIFLLGFALGLVYEIVQAALEEGPSAFDLDHLAHTAIFQFAIAHPLIFWLALAASLVAATIGFVIDSHLRDFLRKGGNGWLVRAIDMIRALARRKPPSLEGVR